MHSAPAVTYPVGRSRCHGRLLGVTGLASVLLGLLWRYQGDPGAWRQALFGLSLLGVQLVAAQVWYCWPPASLHWDGQSWHWSDVQATACGTVTPHIDMQSCMVLSLRTDKGDRLWLWPERSRDPAHWHALRRAVFAHRQQEKS